MNIDECNHIIHYVSQRHADQSQYYHHSTECKKNTTYLQIATIPANRPFINNFRSKIPNRYSPNNIKKMPPAAALSVVLTMIRPVSVVAGQKIAIQDPPLKAKNPPHNIKAPNAASTALWPGMTFVLITFPVTGSRSNLPIRGPTK